VKGPPRLVDGDDLRARLLRSARHDAPTGRTGRRVTAAIALAVGTLASRSTAALAAATVTRSVLFKVLLGAGVVTLVATAPDPPLSVPPAAVAVASPAPPPRVQSRVAPRATAAVPLAEPAASASTPSRAAVPPRAPDTLAAEVALLGDAKRALESGQTAAAFAAIAEHDRRFPHGSLGQEAAALRIEATARGGDRTAAASLARAFEVAYPGSPLRGRVRALGGTQP
jgi:hypothetical protein